VLLEGGTVTSAFTPEEQSSITDIIISHIHLDHAKEIIFLVDNLAGRNTHAVVFSGLREIVEGVKRHIFNDLVWPDFSRLPNVEHPILKFRHIPEGRFTKLEKIEIKPIRVRHTIPANGYVIREPGVSIVYTGDTGPTQKIWREARKMQDLKAILAETSFPNGMEELAIASGHLTPNLLETELGKVGRPQIPVFVFHMKPIYLEQISNELRMIKSYRIEMMHQNRTYTF
jgi:cAMP phosphodiesterase